MAMYDGGNIFGRCETCVMIANPSVAQQNAFFGANGVHNLFGGTRGRVFQLTGKWLGETREECYASRYLMDSYQDGIARDFTDNQGNTFEGVVYEGELQPDPMGPKPSVVGGAYKWTYEYKLQFKGLA